MPYQLTVLYNPPEDPAAFDKHYDEVHAPIAAKLPGLRQFTVSRPKPGADGAAPQFHLVAVLVWDSESDFGAAMGGPEGKAAVDDLRNFAGAGLTMLTGPVEKVS